ncbi:MAG TPA: cation-translocating P-type ATPase [Clostridiales bacterium]|nr:cation-translocating P-type ATPase [Clostridiales bacterium]
MDDTSTMQGLSPDEVEERKQKGLVNSDEDIKTKTIGRIIRDNLFTPFNILNAVLAGLILLVGSYKNLLFMGVIVSNILIGTFQEIRAKKTIDRLSLIATPKVHVVRGGEKQELNISELVIDDILLLAAGNQVCADCVVVDGECEVNESLITGESDPVVKKKGDHLLSGSFLSSGNCHARVEHIGADNYATKITKEAKYLKKPNSEIMQWLNRIIKWIGLGIIPVGLMLFAKQYFIIHASFSQSVISTVAALIGMIPEGLVLLTSVVLAVSVVRLARHKALVQDLYSIETLARVDTLCLDKTGTITEGVMQVDAIVPLASVSRKQVEDAVAALVDTLNDENPTSSALRQLGLETPQWTCSGTVPFSSARKWSGASFEEAGSFLMGAGEFILKDAFESIRPQADGYAKRGHRVLLLAHSRQKLSDRELPQEITPLALILLSDRIRKSARATLEYFSDQGVDIKIISGDNPVTVSNIARRAGLWNADNYVDASTLKSYEDIMEAVRKYSVFGRVTPQQKHDMIKALKEQNHIVAMTGDGVNDVLALKESDCSIAMASGSDASRTVSQVVLLDSDFSSMPRIVAEGRRSINNLQRSAALYIVKALFSIIIGVLFIFINATYPFQPIQFTLINALTIGFPSFILALEPNKERIQGKFSVNVLKKSIPGALAMITNIVVLVSIASFFGFNQSQVSTLAVIITGYTGLLILFRICMPFDAKRTVLFAMMVLIFAVALSTFQSFFSVIPITLPMFIVLIPMMILALCLMVVVLQTIDRLATRKLRRRAQRQWIRMMRTVR